ncbi:formate dehydrogenase accessory sulfurtransferase FdhD [Geotalea sp. SG265]|uniref:formate dehydrogenase accessory sulfurtransferase FdhD n=1 Tax=Geotalea sp. SG265 TaxID=2922867 RepID=UPI001FAFD202
MNKDIPVYHYDGSTLTPVQVHPVKEFPLKLLVNERELATLVASPHDLRFLVAGFLRLQGFVTSLDDFVMFSVCNDFGIANIRIKGELPDKLRPILTSGCGTGVTFTLPGADAQSPVSRFDGLRITPETVFALMDDLARRAEQYRSHGGIHSAAVGDGEDLLLYAEDLGRHNTLDRIAGEALFKGIDLSGKVLVTSGRISSEMVAKASILGIGLMASRTSPTDMAVQLSEQLGITLIGYVRGRKFNVYTQPQRIILQ